ncbi:hypothetical protein [Streptomyces platensis]|uniref:hypothetical protein n=1 Tax=Streptomyces platensis TaxID=58346 RepID=UPI001F399905|nr:hypothetical protein [Streptomyces platensis]MCF3146500.1 hypothetical protein [Streptomyces platensis]
MAAPLALVVLTAAWLFAGAGGVRTAVVWLAFGMLALCVGVVGASALRGGAPRDRTYARAVRAASSASGGDRPAGLPARLHGTPWPSLRAVGLLVGLPTLVCLWSVLAVAEPDSGGRTTALREAGAVTGKLRIAAIEHEVSEGRGRRADATARYTVLLPPANGQRGGRGVPASFTADTERRQEVGGELYVGYVPAHPELGAVGDDQQAEVARKLSGRTVEAATSWVAAGIWILVTLALCAGWWREGVTRRGACSTGEGWVPLRVRVTGAGKHTDAPPAEGTDQMTARERRDNTRQLSCLLLAVDGTDRTVPFHGELSSTVAGTVLAGASGLLVWHPQRRRSKDVLAELIGDDGWQLPGAVPARVAQDMAAAAPAPERGPVPEAGAGRQVRLLDLGAAWSATVPKPLLAGLVCSVAIMGALLAVPDNGAWRLWAGAAGLLAPLAALLVQVSLADEDSA